MLLSVIGEKIPELVGGAVWTLACHPRTGALASSAYFCGEAPLDSLPLIGCGLSSAPVQLVESEFFNGNRFEWDQYNTELVGEDYCA